MQYGDKDVYFTKRIFWNGYGMSLGSAGTTHVRYAGKPVTAGAAIAAVPSPRDPQAVHVTWSGKGEGRMDIAAATPSDISREANGSMLVSLTMTVNQAPTSAVQLVVGDTAVPIAKLLHPGNNHLEIALPCFTRQDFTRTQSVIGLKTDGKLELDLVNARLVENKTGTSCPAAN